MWYFCMTIYVVYLYETGPIQWILNTVDSDGLVLQNQGISSHSAEYAPMCSQFLMG